MDVGTWYTNNVRSEVEVSNIEKNIFFFINYIFINGNTSFKFL